MTKITLTLLASLSFICMGQDFNNDIAVKFNQSVFGNNNSALGLEYRKSMKENFRIKFGVEYGQSHREIGLSSNTVYASSTLNITRQMAANFVNYGFSSGVDYEGFRFFTFGAALVAGYKTGNYGVYDRGSEYNTETKEWDNCYECMYEHYNEDLPFDNGSLNISGRTYYGKLAYTNEYLTYGLSLRAGIKVPLGKRFEITSAYEPSFVRNHFLSTVKKNEITGPLFKQMSSFNQFSNAITAALRFKL